jgi:hypothetical protein
LVLAAVIDVLSKITEHVGVYVFLVPSGTENYTSVLSWIPNVFLLNRLLGMVWCLVTRPRQIVLLLFSHTHFYT